MCSCIASCGCALPRDFISCRSNYNYNNKSTNKLIVVTIDATFIDTITVIGSEPLALPCLTSQPRF